MKNHRYKFRQLPNERDPRWFDLGYLGRTLALELFHASNATILDDGNPVLPIGADWKVSICRTLCITGRERGNICQALERAHELGLIEVLEGFVRVHFRPTATRQPPDSHSTATRQPPDSHSTATRQPPSIRQDLSPANDSTQLGQIDKEERDKDERERDARARDPEPRSFESENREPLALPGRLRKQFVERYLQARGGPPNELALSRMVLNVARWVTEAASARGLPEDVLCDRLIFAFFASPKAAQACFRPGFLEYDPSEWLDPPQPKPIAKALSWQEQREASSSAAAKQKLEKYQAQMSQVIAGCADPVQRRKFEDERDGVVAQLSRAI